MLLTTGLAEFLEHLSTQHFSKCIGCVDGTIYDDVCNVNALDAYSAFKL